MLHMGVGLYGYFVGVPLVVSGIAGVLILIGALYFKQVVLKAGVYSPPL